jgi:hypothetical protein
MYIGNEPLTRQFSEDLKQTLAFVKPSTAVVNDTAVRISVVVVDKNGLL